ncbi:site-specific DNA-methyltransferase [Corynebacterium pseudodiphtheriticum]|uniref:site-specific DNA-methyltransferase n=1 Tax=Corynebacterium pseudodiphtheriticum TaxID=37637 RepID=UPI000F860B89|nr:site-specific DNA-methyltransferase [Corynebacterium pseudodiphtheriticum]MDK4305075.1 site-specific DNA-methyltransferase [Corynebacterium pseudodiphtheriticum]RUQ01286.1 site-specific DNA-methyltransferase [Corynebacterium pseudodiphtheriticum]
MSEEQEMIKEVPGSSPEFRTELAEQIAELAPEAIADGKIDVEKLKELLEGDASDTSERFGLFWPGKKRAMRAAQTPATATLRPDKENSKDWDATKNVFIEGDNLEVLKILQKHYHGKIKMIYIDPPYNTGNDFVYPDNYKEGLETYLAWSKQVNEDGKKLSSNSESEGRYHSNWLNMMYPRLKLARNLLTTDGVIFVSIDDHEVAQLRRIMDEIFGETNFVAQIVWEKVHTRKNSARQFSVSHDYVLCYARKKMRNPGDDGFQRALLPRENTDAYKNPDNDPKGPWKPDPIYANNPYDADYVIEKPNGVKVSKPSGQYWRYSKKTIDEAVENGSVIWGSGESMPMLKRYLSEVKDGLVPVTLFSRSFAGDNSQAKSEVKSLFNDTPVFSYPKPTLLIKRLMQIAGVKSGDTIIDFFAGSSSTADAALRYSVETGIDLHFIQVQLPEPLEPMDDGYQFGFKSIAELSRARICRIAELLSQQADDVHERPLSTDIGFRAYTLADTNFTKWRPDSDIDATELEQHMLDLRESADDNATPDDLLTEILIKQGHSLVEQIRDRNIDGLSYKAVVRVDDEDGDEDTLVLAYLGEHTKPTLAQLREAMEAKPAQFIMLEDAFKGDDELKTNLAQICKTNGIELWTA